MSTELKPTIEAIAKAVEDFKTEHAREMVEVKASGAASAETRIAVDRANATITALETKLADQQKALKEVEILAARQIHKGDQKDVVAEDARSFFAMRAATRKEKAPSLTAELVDQFKAYAEAFRTYLRNPQEALGTDRFRAALSIGSDPAGGYFVLPETSQKITTLMFETSPMRQYATIQPIGTDRLVGYYDLNEDDTGSGWVGETATRTETTTPDVGRYEIPAHEQYANPKASQSVLDDAVVDLESWLAEKVSSRLSRREATAFVTGDGVGKPRGFTDYSSASAPTAANWQRVQYTGTGTSGAFAAAPNGGDVFVDALGSLKEFYHPGAIWAMNRTTKAAARKLKDSNGQYILLPDFRDGFRESILGLPVVGFEDLAAIGASSLSIALGNFKEGYTIVDRQGIRVLRDPYTAKPFVHFYTTRRVGGDVTNFEALKLIRFA